MPKAALTKTFVAHAVCAPGRPKVDYFDVDQRGFMLEVRTSGGKTFYQRYTDERGRERQYKIGPADALTLEQARRKARVVLAQALLGDDPQDKRKELRSIPTLAELVRRIVSGDDSAMVPLCDRFRELGMESEADRVRTMLDG